ncbi:B3 domain-containing protein, partial [Mucuna pruriens]
MDKNKESDNGEEDLVDVRLRMFFRGFLAREKVKHPHLFSFLHMKDREILESLQRKARSMEGTSSNHGNVGVEWHQVEEQQEQQEEQRGKSRFEYLVEVGSAYSVYEENCLEKKKELPSEVKEKMEEMKGCEVKLVAEKELFEIDLDRKYDGFSIPPTNIGNNFLTQEEKDYLEKVKKIAGLRVTVLDPSLRDHEMCFKKCSRKKSNVYNLGMGWNKIVTDNHLKPNDTLQLWSFRVSSKLCFALVKLPQNNNN